MSLLRSTFSSAHDSVRRTPAPFSWLSLICFSMMSVLVVGCSSDSGILIAGRLTFNGSPNSGEILIEPIDPKGNPLKGVPSITVYANQRGDFSAHLENASEQTVQCRVSIRIADTSADGRPAAFDYDAPPEKRVALRRLIAKGQRLDLAINR